MKQSDWWPRAEGLNSQWTGNWQQVWLSPVRERELHHAPWRQNRTGTGKTTPKKTEMPRTPTTEGATKSLRFQYFLGAPLEFLTLFLCCTIAFLGNKHFRLNSSKLLWSFRWEKLYIKGQIMEWVGRVNTPQVWSSTITPRWEWLLRNKLRPLAHLASCPFIFFS